jgi:hypothetical protein
MLSLYRSINASFGDFFKMSSATLMDSSTNDVTAKINFFNPPPPPYVSVFP